MNPLFAQQQMLEQQLLHAAEVMEEQIDSEMKKMDELDEDDIEKIRQRRLKAMQKAHQAKQVSFLCDIKTIKVYLKQSYNNISDFDIPMDLFSGYHC